MERAGFDYSTIWDPNDQAWPEPVTDEEIAVAIADVECKQETNVLGVWMAVEAAYQVSAIRQHENELDALRIELSAEVANATQVLGT